MGCKGSAVVPASISSKMVKCIYDNPPPRTNQKAQSMFAHLWLAMQLGGKYLVLSVYWTINQLNENVCVVCSIYMLLIYRIAKLEVYLI